VQRLLQPEDVEGLDPAGDSMQPSTSYGAFMSSISEMSWPMASRTVRTRFASSAGRPAPVLSLTAR
jgi:hypothetical protein